MSNQTSLFSTTQTDIIYKNLSLFKLPKNYFKIIEELLNGKMREEALVCCHAECDICMITIKQCLKKVKEEILNSNL